MHRFAAATALSIGVALSAMTVAAQTPSGGGGDEAERLALAHRLIAASGGADEVRRTLASLFANVSRVVTKDLPPDQVRLQGAIQKDFLDEFSQSIPSILAETERSYAQHLTVQELKDYLAWTESPSGRAIHAKLPAIRTEIITAEGPMLRAIGPSVTLRVFERVCQEMRCSEADRQVLASRMGAAPGASAPRPSAG